jgi:rod shape-determining protein MreD
MDLIVSFPILLIVTMMQVAGISRLPLVHGTADMTLLVLIAWGIHSRSRFAWIWAIVGGILLSLFSAISWPIIVIPYSIILFLAQLLHGRFWNSPILAMLLVTIFGTLFVQLVTAIVLFIADIPIDFYVAFFEIIIPSILLNLILALPVFFVIKDISRLIYHQVENE